MSICLSRPLTGVHRVTKAPVIITGESLTLEQVYSVCCLDACVELSQEAKSRIIASRRTVEELVERGETV